MFTDISEEIAADPWFKVVEFLQKNWTVTIEDVLVEQLLLSSGV